MSENQPILAEAQRHDRLTGALDARLGLPEGEFSYVLMDWLQRLCVKESFHAAATDLRALLNLAPSERAAEQMNQYMAQDAEIFQVHQEPPAPDTAGEILVATADGKGVPMRRPLEERMHRSHPRRGKGEKANKKQMAYVGAVYSIDRFPRSAADVVDEVCRKQRAEHRPEPQNKQLWAEMTRCLDDSGATGRERLTGAARDRLTHRCQILEAKGESFRLRDARRRQRRATGPS